MDTRTQFLLQLLQKLGAPLMAAINTHALADETGARDAQVMAALLSESVKISISLSQSLNLRPDDGDADAIRVALAALAGSLVADAYKQQGRVPGENDGRRITKALESVIAFSDNFAPAAQHAQRLQTLDGAVPFFDPVQTSLYSMHALVPVISAVSEFSFGQDANRLVQDVADKLGARAKALKDTLGANAADGMGELVTLQALAQIYASAHRAETLRLQGVGDSGQGVASLDAVWASFDRQLAMIEVLMTSMSGGGSAVSRGGGGSVKPSVEVPQETATAPAEPAQQQAAANPMSFFKKK